MSFLHALCVPVRNLSFLPAGWGTPGLGRGSSSLVGGG